MATLSSVATRIQTAAGIVAGGAGPRQSRDRLLGGVCLKDPEVVPHKVPKRTASPANGYHPLTGPTAAIASDAVQAGKMHSYRYNIAVRTLLLVNFSYD